MFNVGDLFQWERFITPSIIQVFYWLVVLLAVLFGLSGVVSGLRPSLIAACVPKGQSAKATVGHVKGGVPAG